ncbi:MAG: AAA family ATPase [candidate division KSB1 bacterium]|nr:AAA family ATPase [candidate division KSB1 bacterium]
MIKHLRIKNYKSLEDLSLELQPLMVFVGPNNAGKSNILDCFQFLADLVRFGGYADRDPVVAARGGFPVLVFNGEIDRKIQIELSGEIKLNNENSRHYRYFISIAGTEYGRYRLERETFTIKLPSGEERLILEFPSEGETARVWDEDGTQKGGIGAGPQGSYLFHFRNVKVYPILGRFAQQVMNWRIFNFAPQVVQHSAPVQPVAIPDPLGTDLASVLHALQSQYPKVYQELVESLQALMTPPMEGGKTFIQLGERELAVSIPSVALADGTLKVLSLLSLLYSPALPGLIGIEEPENHLHVGLMEWVASKLKVLSETTQLLVTTHSPYLLNFLDPEDVVIIEKKEGRTQFRYAKDFEGIKEAVRALGLGELFYSGSLGGTP